MQQDSTTVQANWDRRWKLRNGASRAPVLNAAYIAAYLLDPAFAQEKEGRMMLPELHMDYEKDVLEFIDRVGGIEVKEKLELLLLYGWPDAVQSTVRAISKQCWEPSEMRTVASRASPRCQPCGCGYACGSATAQVKSCSSRLLTLHNVCFEHILLQLQLNVTGVYGDVCSTQPVAF